MHGLEAAQGPFTKTQNMAGFIHIQYACRNSGLQLQYSLAVTDPAAAKLALMLVMLDIQHQYNPQKSPIKDILPSFAQKTTQPASRSADTFTIQ